MSRFESIEFLEELFLYKYLYDSHNLLYEAPRGDVVGKHINITIDFRLKPCQMSTDHIVFANAYVLWANEATSFTVCLAMLLNLRKDGHSRANCDTR
jgi:hypothetical protein